MQPSLRIVLAAVALAAVLPAQKHPVPGDPKRTIEIFDIRDLVHVTPPKKARTEASVPILKNLPVLGNMFRRPGDTKPGGFSAERVRIELMAQFIRGFLAPKLDEKEEVKSLGTGNLMALATADKLAWITQFLNQNREHSKTPIDIDAKFVMVPPKAFQRIVKPLLDKSDRVLERQPQRPPKQSATGRTGPIVNLRPMVQPNSINKYALLENADAREALLIGLMQEKGVQLLTAPRLLTLPLTRAELLLGKHIAYVKDFEIEVGTNSFLADPVIGKVVEGLLFQSTVGLLQSGRIGTDFEFTMSRVKRPIKEISTRLVKGGTPITIQLPEVTQVRLASRVELKPDETALFAAPGLENKYVLVMLRARIAPKPEPKKDKKDG